MSGVASLRNVVNEKPFLLTTMAQNRTFCSKTNIVVKENPLSLTTIYDKVHYMH
jgi:hypothetical protein